MCAQVPLFIDAHVEKWYRFNIRQEFRIKPEADIYRGMSMLKNEKVRNAVMIGTLCSISYLGVYFARNILSVVTPQIIEGGAHGFSKKHDAIAIVHLRKFIGGNKT